MYLLTASMPITAWVAAKVFHTILSLAKLFQKHKSVRQEEDKNRKRQVLLSFVCVCSQFDVTERFLTFRWNIDMLPYFVCVQSVWCN